MKKLLLAQLSLAMTLVACQSPAPGPVQQAPSSNGQTGQNARPNRPGAPGTAPLVPGSTAQGDDKTRPTPDFSQPAAPAPTTANPAAPAAAKPAATQVLQARNYSTATLIAGLRTGAGEAEARAIAQRHGLSVQRYLSAIRSVVFATQGQPVPALLQSLKAEAQLEFVEADQVAVQRPAKESELSSFSVLSEDAEETETEASPSPSPSAEASPEPTPSPTAEPSAEPTAEPTPEPTAEPTATPSPTPTATPAPDDPHFGKQYSLSLMKVPQAWDRFSYLLPATPANPPAFTSDALVGVIGAGVELSHVDLAQTQRLSEIPGAELLSYDAYSLETSPDAGDVSTLNFFKSSYKQGTHSAGIIAAAANNGRGIAGIAPRARVIPIKTAPDFIEGIKALFASDEENQQTLVSVLADAIIWASDREKAASTQLGGVDVLLIETPVSEPSQLLKRAIEYAHSRNLVVVVPSGDKPSQAEAADSGYCLATAAAADPVACGSEGASTQRIYNYLATLDGVLAVGAVDADGKLAAFSATGPYLSLVAPGVDVLSSAPGLISNNAYSYRSGTAVAASQVAGVLALMIGADKASGDAEAFRKQRSRYISYLSSTAQDKGDSGRDDSYGYGLVDAAAALAKSIGQANDDLN